MEWNILDLAVANFVRLLISLGEIMFCKRLNGKFQFKRGDFALLSIILILSSVNLHARTIYVSSTGNDANQGSEKKPILTLHQAKELCKNLSDASFTILLKGGDTFTEHKATESDVVDKTCAFVWDIDKPLTLSTYGPNKKATIYGGYYAHHGGPAAAIAIQEGSTQDVLIENITFEMWEEGAIILEETEDVTIRNIRIDKTGTHYFTDEEERGAFMQAPIYPQAAKRVLIEHVEITNALNWPGDRGGLHGFYCTRMGDLEIRNCLLVNVCGSAFKIRRQPRDRSPNNIYIHDNECYYTGLSSNVPDEESYQPGFLRYSGEMYRDGTVNCPTGIVIENNVFHYPFCWDSEGEDCRSATAMQYSISNKTACGEQACSDPEKVKWINNDFKYQWEKTDRWTGRNTMPPSAPKNLRAVAVSDSQIDLTWEHDEVNGERFIIHRKSVGESYKALRIVDSHVKTYSDKHLSGSARYTYRIKACHDAACSDYSNEVSVTTPGGRIEPKGTGDTGKSRDIGDGFVWSSGFNTATDIMMFQYDTEGDSDDVCCMAVAGAQILHPDFAGVQWFAVNGCYGGAPRQLKNSNKMMELAFGPEDVNWTNAFKDWDNSMNIVVRKLLPILKSGGSVWINEGGKSDFTAAYCRTLIQNGIPASVIKTHVKIYQHSDANERGSDDDDLTWVQKNTDYYKVPDGNSGGNGSPQYRSNKGEKWYWNNAKSPNNPNPAAREMFALLEHASVGGSNSRMDTGGVDFSDHVTVFFIMGEPDFVGHIDKLWARYIINTP